MTANEVCVEKKEQQVLVTLLQAIPLLTGG